jgi:hypothetical protein
VSRPGRPPRDDGTFVRQVRELRVQEPELSANEIARRLHPGRRRADVLFVVAALKRAEPPNDAELARGLRQGWAAAPTRFRNPDSRFLNPTAGSS